MRYLKMNIIEFILIIAMGCFWYFKILPGFGIAILYILASTREKWVMVNRMEELK